MSKKTENLFKVLAGMGVLALDEAGIDWDTTLETIQNRVEAEKDAILARDREIDLAVNQVFDEAKGDNVPTTVMIAKVGTILGGTNEAFNEVKEYLGRCGKYNAKRGVGGGLSRE